MPVKLAPHVPKMASDEGVIEAAKAALGDALLDAVFEDLEVALREASDEPATGIGDRDGDLDDVDAAAERPGLSPHHGATDDTASCDGANSVVFHAATR